MPLEDPVIETSPAVSDEIKQTTCYMCACRCGINVHMKDGEVTYIEGNRDHPAVSYTHLTLPTTSRV